MVMVLRDGKLEFDALSPSPLGRVGEKSEVGWGAVG